MATKFQWFAFFVPKLDYSDARGCEILSGGRLNWVCIPHGESRWVALNRYEKKLVDKRRILVVQPTTRKYRGVYPVKLTGHGTGYTWIDAGNAQLGVLVMPRRTIRVAFRNVENDSLFADWETDVGLKTVKRMINTATRIFWRQGNIRFTIAASGGRTKKKGKLKRVQKGFIWSDAKASDFFSEADAVAKESKAKLTTFFIDAYGGDGIAAQKKNVIVMSERAMRKSTKELIFCHELGPAQATLLA